MPNVYLAYNCYNDSPGEYIIITHYNTDGSDESLMHLMCHYREVLAAPLREHIYDLNSYRYNYMSNDP